VPVVINEFEIVADPQKPEPVSPQAPDPTPQVPSNVRPEDIVLTMQRQRLRLERVRAD
jgi:hypothetical protein